jgi:plastocyanin
MFEHMRRRRLFVLAALLGVAVAVLPAIAASEGSPTIEAVNSPGVYGEHHWMPATATVSAGGVVTLSNPTEVAHGVRWVSGPGTPSCEEGAGKVPVGTTAAASGIKWSGTCKFTQPGTYTFYCTVHGAEMTGTITVNPSGTTTTTTTTTTPPGPPGGTTTAGTPTTLAESPLAGSASSAVKLGASQHGASVHGSVAVSQAGAGGRLEVDLLARSASLAGARHRPLARVGRLVRPSLRAGIVSFTVVLNAKARRALRLHRRLALTVRISLSPLHGSAVTVARSVVLHF